MKRKVVAAKMTALILAAGMTFGSVSFAAERKDAEAIKEENQATEAVSEGETEAAEASDSQKKTEYPVTITTYGSDGLELETSSHRRIQGPRPLCRKRSHHPIFRSAGSRRLQAAPE